ncbi:hypothetical protein HCA58_12170 [Micromonospora sp. HNM0581]|uniref:hypothetical protein n=1 Tax=Micromonospora sp. HNM0581 TaxID=2716341 RepID=UPI00146DEC7A|nr:hypothetical protein [Micromonospora sp. HNM0581]NLU79118.1 hypothetical protein [Micromonospora sp. HNM0581]
MPGSHRRRPRFSFWRSRRPPDQEEPAAGRRSGDAAPARNAVPLRWSMERTRELPALRHAPLLTRGQIFRGNGGRWPR